MSSETDFEEFSAMFERMIEGGSRFLPVILALAGQVEDDEQTADTTTAIHREIVIDPVNRRVVMVRSVDFLNGDFPGKPGRSPASKSSVESMPRTVIGEGEEKGEGACSICLEEWSEGDVAAEMPCKHKFHSKCVEEWLGKHATCPLCRYEMPVEEEEEGGKRVGVWIGLSVNGGGRGRGSESDNGGDSNSNSV